MQMYQFNLASPGGLRSSRIRVQPEKNLHAVRDSGLRSPRSLERLALRLQGRRLQRGRHSVHPVSLILAVTRPSAINFNFG